MLCVSRAFLTDLTMESLKPIKRKSKRPLLKTRWEWAVLALLILLNLASWYALSPPSAGSTLPSGQDGGGLPVQPFAADDFPASLHARVVRKVYPYSVIPGGISNVQELRKIVAEDPVVAAHYFGFDLAHAQVTRLRSERLAYVSYRLGDRLYWTKRKVKLAKDEIVITDGTHTARSRCGNLVSETPSSPTSPDEPPAKSLDTPIPQEPVVNDRPKPQEKRDPPAAVAPQLPSPDNNVGLPLCSAAWQCPRPFYSSARFPPRDTESFL